VHYEALKGHQVELIKEYEGKLRASEDRREEALKEALRDREVLKEARERAFRDEGANKELQEKYSKGQVQLTNEQERA
jgi:hypothetical protein